MVNNIDILDDADGDLLIRNGDIVHGPADQQHIQDLMLAQKGHYTQSAVMGIGIESYIKGDTGEKLRREIKLQLEADGFNVKKVFVKDGDINIDADSK
jgi:hypothetical protein